MKIQKSTAKRLVAQLEMDMAVAETEQDEIELSPVAQSLIMDAVARDQLQAEIDKQDGE